MTTILTRLYAEEKQAQAAVTALKGFEVGLVARPGAKDAGLEALLDKAGVWTSRIPGYAAQIRKGGAVVTVRAEWGTALAAIRHLDAQGPIGADERQVGWHAAAPLSALLGIPVLDKLSHYVSYVGLSRAAAPLSNLLKLKATLNLKPWAGLFDAAAPVSGVLHLATISRAKPFSSLIAYDLLANLAAPFSNLLKLKVLASPTPRAGLLGEAAPLSHLLHLPTISKAKPSPSAH